MITSTNNDFWIVSVEDPQQRIAVQFVPKEIDLSRQPKIDEVVIIGRNMPRYHHYGGSEEIKLTLEFYGFENVQEDVWQKIEWLRAMTFNDGFNSPPPLVNIAAGDLFRDDKLIIKSLSAKMSNFDDAASWLPRLATVELTLSKTMQRVVKRSDLLSKLPIARRQVSQFGSLPTLETPRLIVGDNRPSLPNSPNNLPKTYDWEFIKD